MIGQRGVYSMKYAPLVVFGFNRPEHLSRCLSSLEICLNFASHSGFIFIDGPRNESDEKSVSECVKIAQSFGYKHGFKVISRESNLGLAKSVRTGINQVFENSDSIIVIEDDLLLGVGFLEFVNSALNFYRQNHEVASISGYQYPVDLVPSGGVFLRGADCWGWGTWKDRWEETSFDGEYLLAQLRSRKLQKAFNLNGAIDYEDMLVKYCIGAIDSWAVPWHTSMFLQNRITLFPSKTFVSNEGGDGSGTHFGFNSLYSQNLNGQSRSDFPTELSESKTYRDLMITFYKKNNRPVSSLQKLKVLIKKTISLFLPRNHKN
jgi:hypothetical protein